MRSIFEHSMDVLAAESLGSSAIFDVMILES